jgi:hypothetical protein
VIPATPRGTATQRPDRCRHEGPRHQPERRHPRHHGPRHRLTRLVRVATLLLGAGLVTAACGATAPDHGSGAAAADALGRSTTAAGTTAAHAGAGQPRTANGSGRSDTGDVGRSDHGTGAAHSSAGRSGGSTSHPAGSSTGGASSSHPSAASSGSGGTTGSTTDGGSGGSPDTSTSGVDATQVSTYQPFSGAGPAPGLVVAVRQSGPCFAYGGGVVGRPEYRCFGQQQVDGHTFIWDPCFAGPDGTAAPLLCPEDGPLSNRLVAFTVTGIDGTAPPATSRTPWAIELADGQVCLFEAAAWGDLGPFGCLSGSGAAGGTTADGGSGGASGSGTAASGTAASGSGPASGSALSASAGSTGGSVGGVPGTTTEAADCHQPVAGTPWWTVACQANETTDSPFVTQHLRALWY